MFLFLFGVFIFQLSFCDMYLLFFWPPSSTRSSPAAPRSQFPPDKSLLLLVWTTHFSSPPPRYILLYRGDRSWWIWLLYLVWEGRFKLQFGDLNTLARDVTRLENQNVELLLRIVTGYVRKPHEFVVSRTGHETGLARISTRVAPNHAGYFFFFGHVMG